VWGGGAYIHHPSEPEPRLACWCERAAGSCESRSRVFWVVVLFVPTTLFAAGACAGVPHFSTFGDLCLKCGGPHGQTFSHLCGHVPRRGSTNVPTFAASLTHIRNGTSPPGGPSCAAAPRPSPRTGRQAGLLGEEARLHPAHPHWGRARNSKWHVRG
jgi:hypothetical protein